MKIISKSFLLSSVFSLVLPQTAFASLSSAYASLVDTNQNQAFESRPAPFLKLAAVHFLGNNGGTSFSNSGNPGGQEFLPSDICKNNGYLYEGCPAGYVPGEACPQDSSFVKECINPDIWCKDNGYNMTSCTLPKYLSDKCPYSDTLYKSCEEDNSRACKEAGYSAECEVGKIKDKACPYDSSYGTCVCNPCTGFAYTAAEANAQGYVPGEVCNSCGTMKYKRSEASCDGFKTCDCGGATNAKTCWSGTTKKFDTCKECCDTSVYKYDYSNCTGNNRLSGGECGGKYDTCIEPAKFLYGDGTVSYEIKGTPIIGIVFDEKKRLAAALPDICPEKAWGDDTDDIPGLEKCREPYMLDDSFFETCGEDGRYNTDIMLTSGKQTVASFAHEFEPEGCSADFCKKTKWFVPSMSELLTMEIYSMNINAACDRMGNGCAPLGWYHWSSTAFGGYSWTSEYDTGRQWVMNFYGGVGEKKRINPEISNMCIRMVIKY